MARDIAFYRILRGALGLIVFGRYSKKQVIPFLQHTENTKIITGLKERKPTITFLEKKGRKTMNEKGKAMLTALETIDNYGCKKRVLTPLNNVYGFDFNKNMDVIKISGRWTVNSIMKTVNEHGYIPVKNAKVVLIMVYTGVKGYLSGRVYGIEMTHNGYKYDIKFYRCKGDSLIDNFYRKSDVEDARKSGMYDTYIICQYNDNLSRVYNRPDQSNVDLSQRFVFIDRGYNSKYMTFDGGQLLDITRWGSNGYKSITDKSGYIPMVHVDELKKRAEKLRCERKKSAYMAMDNTATIQALKDRVKLLKDCMIEEFKQVNDYESINIFGRRCYGWSGLSGIYERLETIIRKDTEKQYSSIESFSNDVKNLNITIDGMYKRG